MLLTILVIILVLAVIGGGFGQARIGYLGWSPLGIVLLIILVFWLTGHLHL